jgi:hypothetical protein
MYEHLLPALRARGLNALCRALEARIDIYRTRVGQRSDGTGFTAAEAARDQYPVDAFRPALHN